MLSSWVTEFHLAYTLPARNLQDSAWNTFFFLYNLSLRKEFSWGRVLVFALVSFSEKYRGSRIIAVSTITFSFSTLMLNFILFCSTMRWAGGHVSNVRQAGNTGSCPSRTHKKTSLSLILSFKQGSNSKAKITFHLAEEFNFHLI